jgi:CRP-like cAMP-binding protein
MTGLSVGAFKLNEWIIMEKLSEIEKLVQNHLDRGDKEAAIKQLFEFIVVCARQKNFEAAEALRSRIFDIDAMALGEIIRSGEIIEEEKSQVIDRSHREIWSELYGNLSVEEANALYFGLTTITCQAGETIFEQGSWKPRLYFVNSGRAKIVFLQNGKEFYLKDVGAGQFAGEDTFFSLTVCTTTMIAQSRTDVSFLDSDIPNVWKTGCPALESKLRSFVSKGEKVSELLKAKEMDRRSSRRVNIVGKATALLTGPSETPEGKPFKVDLNDISRGGVCLMVRITRKETAGLLLGKRLCISILGPQTDSSQTIAQCGTVVGIQFHPFEDCTVNVKFDSLLSEAEIRKLEKLSSPAQYFDF